VGDLFYSIGLLVTVLNVFLVLKYKKIYEVIDWLSKYKKVVGRNPRKEDFRSKSDQELLLFWSSTVLITVIWMLFGLMSYDWMAFLIIFIINILLNYLSKISLYIKRISFILKFMKSLIMVIIISFLVINYFHLNFDISSHIKAFLRSLFDH